MEVLSEGYEYLLFAKWRKEWDRRFVEKVERGKGVFF
jgi:hypothetical protein